MGPLYNLWTTRGRPMGDLLYGLAIHIGSRPMGEPPMSDPCVAHEPALLYTAMGGPEVTHGRAL